MQALPLSLLALGLPSRVAAQSCGNTEFEATKILVLSDVLPIQKMGFFPYTLSGSTPPAKYSTETWSGSGAYSAGDIFTGTTTNYTNIKWAGSWSISPTTGTDSSTKSLSYHVTGPFGLDRDDNISALKLGVGETGSLTGAADVTSGTARRYLGPGGTDTRSVSESLTNPVSLDDANAYGQAHKTTDNDRLQYWNNFPSADAVQAAIAAGSMTRISPLQAPARRVTFQAQFCVPCLGKGKFVITYYYKKWKIGDPEPAEFTTKSEPVEFKEPPYVVPLDGSYRPYHFELEQGQQCRLVKVTARPEEDCKDREPGGSSGANHSVDMQFYLGRTAYGLSAGSLAVTADAVSPVLCTPAALQYLGSGDPATEVISSGSAIRQVKAPETFVDVVTLTPSSYELRYFHPSQATTVSGGLYAPTGQPYVTYRVDDPGVTNSVRFTEIRGNLQKVTTYSYDSGSGTMTMSSGDGARSDALEKVASGSTVTETRSIRDAANRTVSVVREVKTVYPFGANVTQRTLDPAGANLTTNYTYYTDPVNDGGAYGQVRLVVEPTGRWTRYTYDAQSRVATTVRQFLDSAIDSADNLNRVSAVTFGTIPDQDGDGLPERLQTTVESLLGQETGRSHEITFSRLGTAYGADVETRWDIRCTVAGAAWDAATNLVTKHRALDSGDWFGKPLSELRPDGTLTIYNYATDGSSFTTTTYQGAANSDATAIVAGTRTVVVQTLVGRPVLRSTYDYPSNTLIASEVVTQVDGLGRPTRLEYLDGTYELRSYACCGLDMATDRQGITTNYLYNKLGQVDRVSRAGLAQESTLDPDGRLLARKRIGTDNSEITTESHGYDAAGRLVWSKDALNRQTTFSEIIDNSGHTVRTTTHPDGGTVVQTFAKDGSLLSVSGTAAPQRLSYEYGVDADGMFTKEIRVGSSNETTEWVKSYSDLAGRAYKRVYADGATESSIYNSAGQLERQVDPDGVTTLFAYNSKGEQEISAIDLNGNNAIDFAADRITRTTTVIATRGSNTVQRSTTESWETDNQSTPVAVAVSETAVDGLVSWQTTRGLTTSIVTTLNGTGGRTTVTTAPDGTVSTQVFSNDRLTSRVTSHASLGTLGSASYAYDTHGRLQTETDSRNGTTTYNYFSDDQIQSVTTPDPDTTRAGAGYDPQTTTYAYDSAGRQSQVTQPDATVVYTTYWPTGAVKRTWGSRTFPVEYTYDPQGRVKTLTTWQDYAGNAGTAVTTWSYTPARGFLQSKRYADNTGPAYSYKPSGRLQSRTWSRGIVTTYGYTPAGDLNSVDYSDGTAHVGITYDRAGRPKTTTDASGTRLVTYDVFGQPKDEDYTGGPLNGLGVRRAYDSLGRLATLSVSPSLSSVSYSYDAASRLSVVAAGANTATYAYVPNSSLVSSLTFRQSGTTRLTTTKTYDRLNRLSGITNASSAAPLPSLRYDYNGANQRARATREDNAYWEYGYDSLGQVNSATKRSASGDPVPGLDYSYAYDDIGNRRSTVVNSQLSSYAANLLNQYSQKTVPGVIDVLGTAVADASVTVNGQGVVRLGEAWHRSVTIPNTAVSTWNEFTVAGVRSGQGPGGSDAVAVSKRKAWLPKTPELFSYDLDGNLLSDGRWSYTWDGENRLAAMETRADIVPPFGNFPLTERRKLEFTYDAQGRRIKKKVSTWTGTAWQLVSSTHFLYDGWNLLADLNALNGNAVTCTYTWGLDLSGSMQGAGGVGGLLFAALGTQQATSAAACDGNGNVIALVAMSSGSMAATYEFSAFGETLISDGSAASLNPFRFSTKYTDNETGLLYYGLRYYNPGTGRWLNRDPIEEQGGTNVYAFVGNAPIDAIDLIGLASVSAPPPFDPCNDPCGDLLESLKQLARHIRGRYNDMLLDKGGLYGSRFSGPNSWSGHQKQFQGKQKQLRDALDEYRNRGCGDPIPAFVPIEAFRAVPDKPLRAEVNALNHALNAVPLSDRALDRLQTGALVTAGAAATVATAGLAGPYVTAALTTGGGLVLATAGP